MIKVLALDIYGTVLSSNDYENVLPVRKGTKELFDKCRNEGIRIVSASDANLDMVRIDLGACGMDISDFDRVYRLVKTPKEFGIIISDYKIKPSELLVVGDSLEKDIAGAIATGAQYRTVIEYRNVDSFNLVSVLD